MDRAWDRWRSDATRLANSFSRCSPMWFLSMGLRQGSGLPVRCVTKTWSVVLLNKKIHILLSPVCCVWQVVKTPTIILNNPVLYFPQAAPPIPFLNTVIEGALLVTTYTSLFSRSSFLVSYPSHKNVFTGNSCRNWCQKLFCNNTLRVTTARKHCKLNRILTSVVSCPNCEWACKNLLLDFN